MREVERYVAAAEQEKLARDAVGSSHRWAYDNHRQGLHGLLSPQWTKNVDFVDLSIPKAHPVAVDDDPELAREICNRVTTSDVLLVFGGMYANGSEWVKFETHAAFCDHCPIIAVVPNGRERVARTATKFAARTVRWRGDSIRSAIWELLPDVRKAEIFKARRVRAEENYNALFVRPQSPPSFDWNEAFAATNSQRAVAIDDWDLTPPADPLPNGENIFRRF